MSKPISLPRTEGMSSRQAHADLPTGTVERELGREGFSGPATHMYHTHPPTDWVSIDGPLRPRAFDTKLIEGDTSNPYQSTELFFNQHIQIRHWRLTQSMSFLVRNSDGDELLFIHQGHGELYCDYGHMTFSEGDYIVIPRGTLWRLSTHSTLLILLIEATDSAYQLPDKGILGKHAIFDPAILDTPSINDKFKQQQLEETTEVFIKRHNALTKVIYPYNPLDAIGWHGELIPVKLNWRDIRPIMSHRYHIPPSVHTTFLTDHFIICTFCPRPIETDPGALKVPFFHNNDDYDELIFYHQGDFFSRDNIHPGMMTLHPSGLPHGPHPNARKTGDNAQRTQTDEVALMVDTRAALLTSKSLSKIEWPDYVNSWKHSTIKDPL